MKRVNICIVSRNIEIDLEKKIKMYLPIMLSENQNIIFKKNYHNFYKWWSKGRGGVRIVSR